MSECLHMACECFIRSHAKVEAERDEWRERAEKAERIAGVEQENAFKAERERDEWKDIAMKEQRRSRRIAREALEAGDE